MSVFDLGNYSLLQLSIFCSLFVYLIYTISNKITQKKKLNWLDMMMRIFAASMIPTSFALILIPIFPDMRLQLEDFGLQIAISGIILLHYLIESIFQKVK